MSHSYAALVSVSEAAVVLKIKTEFDNTYSEGETNLSN